MKTILITGASGNLGFAVTKELAGKYNIIAMDASDPRDEYIDNKSITPVECDLSDPGQVKDKLDGFRNRIDHAVLTVGGFAMGDFSETSADDIRKMITLNFETAYHIVRYLLKGFLEKGHGQFILVGARPALEPDAGKRMVAYSLSKKLVFALSELINAAGNGSGVHSTVLVPSIIDTPANRSSMPDADFSKWVPAEKIAETVSFLLGDAGSMIRDGILRIYNKA